MPERVACNLCGSDNAKTLYLASDYRLGVDRLEWPVVQCRRCGLGYLSPRPTRDEIARYYPEHYFGYRGRLQDRYERESRYLPGPPGRLLDIGAARGDFLARMQELGWEVEGIEPFAEGESQSRVPIRRVPFPEGCDLADEQFDVVTAWAVFEHLHDPRRAFLESARLLRPGGTLVVQVPNLRSISGRFAPFEDVPRHLYFFSPAPLAAYGREAGLRLVRIHHVTDLFSGASGREALRYWVARALGKSQREFFQIYRTPRKARFRTWPVTSTAMSTVGLSARVLIPDWFVRAAQVSGQIVAIYEKSKPVETANYVP